MKQKTFFILFCLSCIILQFIFILYYQRTSFLTEYNIPYWKDRYEHSQWALPLSKRSTGDDALYAYSGYRLMQGENPAFIIADKPPFGLFLIGLSIVLFKNPSYYALLFGLGTLAILYFIFKSFLKETYQALFTTAAFFLDPLFFTQLWKPLLDISQLFFLALNLATLLLLFQIKKYKFIVALLCGLSLGFFIEIKLQVIFPILFLIASWQIIYKKLLKEYFFYIVGIICSILFTYFRFLELGFNIFDIVRVHKHITSIYLQSQVKVHFGAIWQTIFTGNFPDIVTGLPIKVTEWWLFLPVVTSFGILSIIIFLFRRNIPFIWKSISVFVIVSLVIYSIIPSYPRYLLVVLPFLYLFTVKLLSEIISRRLLQAMFCCVLLYGLFNSITVLTPYPDSLLQSFYHNFSHKYYQDIYEENLANINKPSMTREAFHILALQTLKDTTIQAIDIKEEKRNISPFTNKGFVTLKVTYKTQRLGAFVEEKNIQLVKEQGQWKIQWDWNLLLNNFRPGNTIEVQYTFGKRGSIINNDGEILAQDKNGYSISINPKQMDTKREQDMLKTIGNIGFVKSVHLQNAYLENALSQESIPIITTYAELNDEEKNNILSYPGISITSFPTRIYANSMDPTTIQNVFYTECCTRIYSSYNYHGVSGVEKKFDKLLSGYDGGKILMKNKDGKIIRKIIEKEPKNGKDIVL